MKNIVMLLIIFCPVFSNAGELDSRQAINEIVSKYFSNSEFSELERMAAKFRNERSRTSSGLWKLTLFYSSIDQIVSYKEKREVVWKGLIAKTDEWIRLYPNSPAAYIAKSTLMTKWAWSIRGTGFANTVEKNAWKPFYAKVNESRNVLEQSASIANQDPHWYVSLAQIAIIQSWSEAEFSQMVYEGLDNFPDYYSLYFTAMDYYTPKWRGNANAIERFARMAIKRSQKTEGYGMYARIYWVAYESQYGNLLFFDSKVDWETMKKGIDDVIARYPDKWNINNFAYFSCLAQDKKQAAKLIAMIGGQPIVQGWADNLENYTYCKRWTERPEKTR